AAKDLRMWLSLPDLGREDREVEALREAHLLEIALEEPARVEGVRDERELEPAVAQGFEQRVRIGGEAARGIPRLVLGLEEAVELLVVERDAEMAEQLAEIGRASCRERV